MKILVFYPYVPYPLDRGTNHRTFHLLRELAGRHEVHLLALAERGAGCEHRAVFEEFCDRVEIVPFEHPPWQKLFPKRLLNPLPAHVAHWTLRHVQAALQQTLDHGGYDAVHVCDIVLAQYFMREQNTARRHPHLLPPKEGREETGPVPIIIDRSRVDLQYQLMEHRRMKFPFRTRLLRCEGYLKLWFYERAVARRAIMQIVCGPDDEHFIRRHVSRSLPVEVVVNGVDLAYFHPRSSEAAREARPTILFCGAMDYNPNIDALRWYFSEMHGLLRRAVPDLQLLIVGRNPGPEIEAYQRTRPGVTVTGAVPDVRPYYRRAWLQIVPLRIGGGTRLKIVESMGMGTPVVSTSIGAQGLNLRHERDVLLADTAEAFLRETVRALRDSGLRRHLEEQALETARARFSWHGLGDQLAAAYARALPGPGRQLASGPVR